MLLTLHIRDFVIVDHTELSFEPGFTVFSGETGAGKSILIDALALALGGRGDASAIRQGANRTDITAIFRTPAAAQAWLEANELTPDDELILRRTLDSQGRSRAFINGQPVPLAQLREVAELLVDIHGQHAHQSLLKTSSQRELLDTQGGLLDLAGQVQQAWKTWQAAQRRLEEATRNAEQLNQERERLEWQLADLDKLALGPDEWESLNTDHNRLAHAQALLDGATQALALLDAEDAGAARQQLNAAAQRLQKLLAHDPQLGNIHDTLESARIAIAEVVSDLNSYVNRVDLDPESLVRAEQRMAAIFDTARKFRVEPEALPALHDSLRRQLEDTRAAVNPEALQQAEREAAAQYQALATQLGKKRSATAVMLSKAVTQAMQSLSMSGGRFQVELAAGQSGPHGNETVEFLVAGHAGTTARPLAKVASGGELARIALALSVIASQAARVPTLIFDEVDTGIGGAVAEVVGQLLQQLGSRHQVLCVTHLPQVAARAGQHFQVSKAIRKGETVSAIQALPPAERVQEIARMLGGLNITETTLLHAREMLEGAGQATENA